MSSTLKTGGFPPLRPDTEHVAPTEGPAWVSQGLGQRASGRGPEVIKPWVRGHQAMGQRSSSLGPEVKSLGPEVIRPWARGHQASGQRSSSRRPTAAEYVLWRSAKHSNIFLWSMIQHLDFHFLNPPRS